MTIHDLRPTQSFTAEGWTQRRIAQACASGKLDRLRRGVYSVPVIGDAEARHRRLAAAATSLRTTGSVVSHTSAAVFHGLPVRRAALERIHLTRAEGGHGRHEAGVHLHHAPLAASEITLIDGVPVTTLERTIADIGRMETFAWGVVLTDAALAREPDRILLADYVDSGRRRRGNRTLTSVLEFADPRAESPAESLSRVSMLRAGIPRPELQFDIVNADGEWVARSDFGWPELGVVGEVDGRVKYDSPDRGRSPSEVIAAQVQREELIKRCGWWVTRWDWETAVDHQLLGEHLRQAFRAAHSYRAD
ncbi:MAG: hypothetical protein QM708_03550 [Propioniciclava sp.]|uniref:hypothetical protein n=1 Tax=Propioniciclava sp. TaxID=2038686 RepID=UPI0039E6C2A0